MTKPNVFINALPAGGDQWTLDCSACGPVSVVTDASEDRKEVIAQSQLHLMQVHGANYDDIYRRDHT